MPPRSPAEPGGQAPPPRGAAAAGLAVGVAGAPVAAAGVGGPAVAGAITSAAAEAVVGATLTGLGRFFRHRRTLLARDVIDLLEMTHPERPPAERRAIVQDELELEAEFQRRSTQRWEEGLRVALAEPNPAKRGRMIQTLLDQEARFQRAREAAIATRAVSRAELAVLKEVSPEGAYWRLSPHVQQSTPDCVALANRFWPHSVLERIHPPMHHGCACALHSLDEAVANGWMRRDQVPDEAAALRRAKVLLRAHPEHLDKLQESWLEDLHPRDRRGRWVDKLHLLTPLERAERRLGRWRSVGGTQRFVPEAVRWTSPDGRHVSLPGSTSVSPTRGPQRPTVAPPRGSAIDEQAARVIEGRRTTLTGMIQRALESGKVPDLVGVGPDHANAMEAAGFRLVKHAAIDGGQLFDIAHIDEWHHPEARAYARVATTKRGGVDHIIDWQRGVDFDREVQPRELDGPAHTWEDVQRDAFALADELAREHDTTHVMRSARVVSEMDDTTGERTWAGDLRFGLNTGHQVVRAASARERGVELTDSELQGVWLSHQTVAHEVIHAVNPIESQDFSASDAARNLEEALTEELSQVITADRLRRQGQLDVLRWRRDHAGLTDGMGTYLRERAALKRVVDAIGVPEFSRERFLAQLKFETPPGERIAVLGDLLWRRHPGDHLEPADAEDRVRALLTEGTGFEAEMFEPIPKAPFLVEPDLSGLPGKPPPPREVTTRVAGRRVTVVGQTGRYLWIDTPEGLVRLDEGSVARWHDPVPTGAHSPGLPPRQALITPATGVVRKAVDHTLGHIGELLDLPDLPPVTVKATGGRTRTGSYDRVFYELPDGSPAMRPAAIKVSARDASELTVAHEFAHFIDNVLLSGDKQGLTFGSDLASVRDEGVRARLEERFRNEIGPHAVLPAADPELKDWWDAVRSSEAYQELGSAMIGEQAHHRYLRKPRESFARSFQQWLATRSGSGVLKAQLERWIDPEKLRRHHADWANLAWNERATPIPKSWRNRFWQPADFEPIADALDHLFLTRGWLTGEALDRITQPTPLHKDTPKTFWNRMEALGHERPALQEGWLSRGGEHLIVFDPKLHARGWHGHFVNMLNALSEPKALGRGGGKVRTKLKVAGTPHVVERARGGGGFLIKNVESGSEHSFATAEGAADHVKQRLESADLATRARDELAQARAETAAARAERAARVEAETAERVYHRRESPTQTGEHAAAQEASGELWGLVEGQYGAIPKVKAHAGPLPEGVAGVEFTTDTLPDPASPPHLPTWTPRSVLGTQQPRGIEGEGVRLEGSTAKLRIRVRRNTQIHAPAVA